MHAQFVLASKPEDVEQEAQFNTLNRLGYTRGGKPEYQWYLLVNEASAAASVPIDESVKDYLGMMLTRFMNRRELFEQLAAFDIGHHAFGKAQMDAVCVQDIADIALQYVAFFPERSFNRHQPRTLEYVANMGIDLYRQLARSAAGKDDWFSLAFKPMATSFGKAVMVLRSLCPRFALRRALLQEKFRENTVRFPNDAEILKLDPALRNFKQMYFQPENAPSLIIN